MSATPTLAPSPTDPPPPTPPGAAPAEKTWSVGTLTYNKKALILVFVWMVWGDIVFTLVERVFPQSMPLQLKRLGIDTFYISMLMNTLSQFVHIPMNPFLSVGSDRTRTRFGRRIPYIFMTLIPLSVCMLALGYSDEIGAYIKNADWLKHFGLGPIAMVTIVMGTLIILFDFFNAFINTIWYYLGADVIPKAIFGRYTSIMKIASLGAGSLFGFFIQQYVEIQTKYVYMGGAVLCFLGFGLMCWKVKEGQYPPPKPIAPGDAWYMRIVRPLKLVVTECFKHPVYISFFISNTMIRFGDAAAMGYVFFFRGFLHIGQGQMGVFNGTMNWVTMLLVFPLGSLVDKIHPMRATLIAMICIIPLSFLGFYMDSLYFYWFYFIIRMPFMQLSAVAQPPLEVTLYPRKQYGQFASANGTVRSLFMLGGSLAGGAFLSFFERRMGPSGDRYAFLWLTIIQAVAFGCMFTTYIYWKKYGAEKFAYDPDKPLVEALAAELQTAPKK